MYTHPFFEATPPGAATGPRLTPGPVFATSGGVNQRGLGHIAALLASEKDEATQKPLFKLLSYMAVWSLVRALRVCPSVRLSRDGLPSFLLVIGNPFLMEIRLSPSVFF